MAALRETQVALSLKPTEYAVIVHSCDTIVYSALLSQTNQTEAFDNSSHGK